LREHLLEDVPVTDLCEKHGVNPTQFYPWQKQLFENGAAVFSRPNGAGASKKQDEEIRRLEDELCRKDEVLAELMAAHVLLKNVLGRFERLLGRAGCEGSGGGFRAILGRLGADQRAEAGGLDRAGTEQVLRLAGLDHVRTSPYYSQSNGKIERWHQTLKADCILPGTPFTPDDARRIITRFVERYNTVQLHSAIGYVAPMDKLAGRDRPI
jgi:transposase-like protein